MNPEIGKYPVEYYGYFYNDQSEEAIRSREKEQCPFLSETCKKRRKSDNDITIGTCSVGYKKRGQSEYSPHIICPHRFEVDGVFEELKPLFEDRGEFFRVPEVPLLGTSIDYVAGKRDAKGEVIDFAGVEIQALDTTGSVWPYKEAYEREEDMNEVDGSYGINWAMSITKTMMQQAWKKGHVFNDWGENIIFLLQDESLEYLHQNANTTSLHPAREDDPVHFYAYSMNYDYDEGEYILEIDSKVSSDMEGVSQMMNSSDEETPPTKEEFQRIVSDRF
ncbi:NotI family restriction endonuclease [Halapricum hydrolyticum]|uniref:NotI family restriction endonuclease n=1 Tax=Halapricum hydrolyticum TaxID=2979991 RepID=A0AAE3I9D4_9EURY|nr:NotI family restriction endonuclease [Halapricum hydrolyticum]MCU4716609.1 NotI family restriction endonuclease [Halapricum hydrolyticum]MCU4725786.1 NotI family restriction endonuclease [Halapricum hydrolyticum]